MPTQSSRVPSSLILWIAFCAYWSGVGWALSGLHALNPAGYAVSLLLGLGLLTLACLQFRFRLGPPRKPACGRLRRRFRRPLPLAFLILAILAFLGGAIYAPNNYDALAYRFPRLLNWLAEGRWHWIHTDFNRLNTRGCGFEWVAAPMFALARTDRFLFLYNVISFSLLPGLVFSSFRRFGVPPRVAYAWMWLAPVGYCFLLQAGSLGNDLFVATFVLAAVDFALRARSSLRIEEGWLSLLAFALATGVKANALPMALAWLILIAPCWRCFFPGPFRGVRGGLESGTLGSPRNVACLRVWVGTLLVGALALLVSFLPTAVGNWRFGGEWTGGRAEKARLQVIHPVAGPVGNLAWFLVENFMPPVAPFASVWNQRVAPHLVPPFLRAAWDEDFISAARLFQMGELQTEENAGLGLSVSGLLALSVLAAWRLRCVRKSPRRMRLLHWAVAISVALAVAAVFRASAVRSLSRLLSPCYLPLVMVFLVPDGHERLVRSRGWRGGALAASALGGLLLVLSPARPLFPTSWAVDGLRRIGCPASLVGRVDRVYSVYAHRAAVFAPAVELLPPGEKVIGVVTYDDPVTSLWKPFGRRRLVDVCLSDRPEPLLAAGIRYVWVNGDRIEHYLSVPLDQWLRQFNGRRVRTIPLVLRAEQGPVSWYLVRLLDPNEHAIHVY